MNQKEIFSMEDFESDLKELDELQPIESPACIIGPYWFVSS